MAFIDKKEVFERFKQLAFNSSHFVWLVADLSYFETSEGWVFAYQQIGKVTLFALEPLMPNFGGLNPISAKEFQEADNDFEKNFQRAWNEVCQVLSPKVFAFVSIYRPFTRLLSQRGFQTVKIGEEPWIHLMDCIPKGNAGKGVRSARNYAINCGVVIEELTTQDLRDEKIQQQLRDLLHSWKNERLIELGGFMNSIDPFAHMEVRRYFVARSKKGQIQAFLIATPIAGIKSYFLEDMILGKAAPKGTGELITLEAMLSLQKASIQKASLGVVSITKSDSQDSHALPPFIRFFMVTAPKYLTRLYNVQGLEIFRKRFKPHEWHSIYLAVGKSPDASMSDTRAWLMTIWALLRSFRPTLRLSFQWLWETLWGPVKKYPVSFAVAIISLALFGTINRFGSLPVWALAKYGFTGSAPFHEWLMRSIVSDYLYFDPVHFWVWGSMYICIIAWAESTNKKKFFIPYFILLSVLDDFINYGFVIKPFNFFRPSIFNTLIAFKDVGGSLVMVTLLGLQLCLVRKHREILFVILSVGLVFGFAFDSQYLQNLILNLNHFLFLALGYVSGKIRFEIERNKSRRVAKNKAPKLEVVPSEDALSQVTKEGSKLLNF